MAKQSGSGPAGDVWTRHRSGARITAPLPVPLRLAGTTAFLLASAGRPSAFAQALIMQQMARTIRVLSETHRTNNELREVDLLNDMVAQQLILVGRPLPHIPELFPESAPHAQHQRAALGPIGIRPPSRRSHQHAQHKTSDHQGQER